MVVGKEEQELAVLGEAELITPSSGCDILLVNVLMCIVGEVMTATLECETYTGCLTNSPLLSTVTLTFPFLLAGKRCKVVVCVNGRIGG